jgi:hypothetical protein
LRSDIPFVLKSAISFWNPQADAGGRAIRDYERFHAPALWRAACNLTDQTEEVSRRLDM